MKLDRPAHARPPCTRAALRQRGMTLMHMLVAMPLIAVFLVIASKLFITNNTMLKVSVADQERLGRTDIAVHQLRRDAWTADQATVEDDRLSLRHGPATTLWRLEDDGMLTRTAPEADEHANPVRRYEGLGTVTFERVPGGVVLILDDERYLCPLAAAEGVGHDENRPKP